MTSARKLSCLVCAAALATFTAVGYAAENPWNGTWKLDAAKSKMTGSVDTVSTAPDGKMTVVSAGLSYTFGCDGAEYPIPGGRTVTCNKISSTELETISKVDGVELGKAHRTLSDGGKTMTVNVTGKTADGTAFDNTEVYKKTSSDEGWDGTWQNTKEQMSTPGLAIVSCDGTTMTFSFPQDQEKLTAKLDGTPATLGGPHTPTGLTISLTADGPRTVREVDTMNGTVLEHDTMTVSADGKTMTMEVNRTGDPDKQVYVYDKQ